jgi:hypothetical protein
MMSDGQDGNDESTCFSEETGKHKNELGGRTEKEERDLMKLNI